MDRHECEEADATDPLAWVRDRFALPEATVYLDGNSLGAMQHTIVDQLDATVRAWRDGLISSWNDADWLSLAPRAATRIARLIGADDRDVVVADSTSSNLFKALAAASLLRDDRNVLLTDDDNFPTDLYVAAGLADLVARLTVRRVPTEAIGDAVDDDVAVVTVTHVDYRSGRRQDARRLTARAHAAGALVVWDLSHSTGAVPVDVTEWDADFAVGCTYKYLNGGPGSPAYLYVAPRWQAQARNPLRGWFGHRDPFAFDGAFVSADGAGRFANGTPPVLAMAALEAATAIWDDLEAEQVFAKSRSLTTTFVELFDAFDPVGMTMVTPRDPALRGAHVAVRHPAAAAVVRCLASHGVVVDHRPPDLVRFGFAPLYLRHTEVYDAVETLVEIVASRQWDRPEHQVPRAVP